MAERDPESDAIFRDIVAAYAAAPDVSTKRMFGSLALTVDGRIACFANGAGSLVAKLPAHRVQDLAASGIAGPWAMRGRRMKEWSALPRIADDGSEVDWFAIAEEAVVFVRGLRG